MPQESKRQGVSSSEIILGFPITDDNQPRRESQQAYAFLPIRDYGFEASLFRCLFLEWLLLTGYSFLFKPTSLLVASREDIDDSSEWNHALRNALFTACSNTMTEFNRILYLRYVWPRYLVSDLCVKTFLTSGTSGVAFFVF
jgi:hypothetical protein